MPLANIESYAKDGAVPDKAALWTYPEISDGWYRIHNTIKAEMAKFSAGLAACTSPLEAWQVEALQAYWKGHSNLVNVHHEHEDTMFTPMLKEKVNYPEKLEADHDALMKMMAGVDSAVAALAAGGDVAALVAVFDPFRKTMEAHLKEEEEICVPLMFAYFDQYVGKRWRRSCRPWTRPSWAVRAPPEEGVPGVVAQEGIQFSCGTSTQGRRAKYRAAMRPRSRRCSPAPRPPRRSRARRTSRSP